jgi:hypothetical protein
MKKKFIYIILGLFILSSCEKDETKVIVSENPVNPQFTSPDDGSKYILTLAEKEVLFITTWTHAEYGFPTVISYVIQMDTIGGTFKKSQMVGATTNDTSSIKYSDLNTKLKALKLKAGIAKDVRLRIRSMVNDKLDTLYSDERVINFTPY